MTRAARPRLQVVPNILRGPADSPKCGECPLAKNGKPGKTVPGEGPAEPLFIVIGEGPGQQELLKGRPFVGRSGKLLEHVLENVGVSREDVWLTNATICAPDPSKRHLQAAQQCCRPRLNAELAKMPGRPILTLGAVAAHTVLGNDEFKITELAGALYDVDIDGTGERVIIPAIHPAAILRGGAGSAKKDRAAELGIWGFTYDVGKLVALARGNENVRFQEDIELEFGDHNRALSLMKEMQEDALRLGLIAIDIETTAGEGGRTAKDSLTCAMTSIGVSNVEWALSMPYELYTLPVWNVLREMCGDERIAKTYHNRQFDEQVLERYGIVFHGERHDTMLRHHAAFPGSDHKLQRVVTQFFARSSWKSDFRHGDGSMEEECEYNAKDALGTARVDPLLDTYLDQTKSRECYETDNALAPIAMRMTRIGVPIDRGENEQLAERFLTVMDRTREDVEEKANRPEIREKFIDHLAFQMCRKPRKADPPGFLERHAVRVNELTNGVRGKKGQLLKGKEPIEFSVSKTDHVIAVIQALGYKLAKVTPTGKYAGDKEVLESLTHVPEVRTILEWRDAAYLYSHFVRIETDGKPGLPLDGDDVLHTDWTIHKITGRWGSSPNLQNWPKSKVIKMPDGSVVEKRPNLRKQVIALPGRTFIGADYAQLEARIIGMMSGDEFLCNIFLGAVGCNDCETAPPGKYCPAHDVHTVFACEVFPGFLEKSKAEYKELRDLVKRGEYGAFYGAAIETMYSSIVKEFPEVTLAQVAKIVQIIANKMPKVALWHQSLMKDAIQTGEIRSAILGRRRCFPMGHADPTVVRNHPVQATAADVMNLGFLRLIAKLTELGLYRIDSRTKCAVEPILQVHDSIVLDVDVGVADDVVDIVTRMLSQEHTFNGTHMIYPAEAERSDVWAELG